jgi:hypothetical protein
MTSSGYKEDKNDQSDFVLQTASGTCKNNNFTNESQGKLTVHFQLVSYSGAVQPAISNGISVSSDMRR